MLKVIHLTKRYDKVLAIQDVSFHVEKGEILGFLGPNGAGKTTTMRILTGFLPATSGRAEVAGFDVFDSPMDVKRRTGYLPENPPLYMDQTVREYLAFVAGIKGVPRRRRPAAIDTSLEKCGLTEVRGRLIGNLSKGYRQRVGLAQALVHDPDVLILDEPTVGLDPKQIIEIRTLIRSLSREHTIVLSSHILPEITATCNRVVIIHHGRVVAVDTLDQLTAQMRRSEKIRIVVKTPPENIEEKFSSLPGVLQVMKDNGGKEGHAWIIESELDRDVREASARLVLDGEWGLLELRPVSVSLEEVFLQLTTEEKEGKV